MTLLKKIFQSKLFVIILTIVCFINFYFKTSKIKEECPSNIMGIVTKKSIDNKKLSFVVNNTLVNKYINNNIDEINALYNDINLGDRINISGTCKLPSNNTNFHLFNYKLYLKSLNINNIITLDKINIINKNKNLFYNIKNSIIKKIDYNINKEYYYTFILGNTSLLDNDIKESYRSNGISHLFSISGMHISLLSSIILFILNKIKKSDFNYIIVSIFLFFYTFLASFTPSVIRSFFMFLLIFINKKLKLEIPNLYLLFYIALGVLLYNPYYIYNVGFLFSYIISFFLIKYSSVLSDTNNYLKKVLLTSLISFLAGTPIMINTFFKINLLSIIWNIIFVPLVSLVIFPISLLSFMISPINYILSLLLMLLEYLSSLLSEFNINIILSYVPWYLVIAYYILIIFILEKLKRHKYKYLIIFYLVLLIHTNIFNLYDEIHILDVGQGDSILIRLKHNKGNVLIDTGGIVNFNGPPNYNISNNIIIPYLHSLGIKKIDYLILTHGDYDHAGETLNLIDKINIDKVYMNSNSNNKTENDIISKLDTKKIQHFNINTYTLNVRNNNFYFINKKGKTENDDSLVIYTVLNNNNILLMGDAGVEVESYIMDEYNLPKMDILKVGHHGSKYSSSKEFLKRINPNYAFISVGLKNKFGHPHQETLDNLNDLNIPYYMTSINGSIKIVLKNNMNIYTCNL